MGRYGRWIGRSGVLLFLFACSSFSNAQKPERYNLRPDECDAYDKIAVPAKDLPSREERSALANCNSEDLYFGFGTPVDAVKARKCAYLEREMAGKVRERVFGGAGLLAMIYANGKGADRNFDLAAKFSCEIDGAPAENLGRFEHLQKLKNENWTGDDFHLCDDATSGFMGGICAGLEEEFNRAKRERKLAQLISAWNPAEKQAFEEIRKAGQDFFQASSYNEVDLTGTLRGAFVVEAKAGLNDGFLAALERFEKRDFPKFTDVDFTRADAKLNSLYSKIQSKTDSLGYTTITPAGVKTTQRAWLRYREAWVTFGQIKYPSVAPESWRTWLTKERIKMLSSLL